jgi:hypothetical protein
MASLRKKYAERVEVGPASDEPPISTPPQATAAELPEPAPDVKPPPEIETQSPADVAAKTALRARLEEMNRAEALTRQAQQSPPPQQPPPQPAMPPAVEKFLAEHPQYMDPNDVVAQAEIQLATLKTARDGLTWNDDNFIPSIERHLGLRREQQPQPQPQPRPQAQPQPQPRNGPVRQQRISTPVSAPPSREPASMSTGRPQSFRAPLTAEEVEIARASGITPERYAQEKEKMLRMKAAGQLDDRR